MTPAMTLRSTPETFTELADGINVSPHRAAARGLIEHPRVVASRSGREGSRPPADKPPASRKERNYSNERIKAGKEAPI